MATQEQQREKETIHSPARPYRRDFCTSLFDLLFNCLHDPKGTGNDGYREFSHGKHAHLIINEGGIQNANLATSTKALLKGYDWQNVYKLLPDMPKTNSGKFTGKIQFHTNEGHLQAIHFITKN